jgi:AcrR family transcriptional regulator
MSDARPRPGRLAARSQASTSALLEVARRTFGTEGYARTSLDRIVADARLTKGAVYHHFGAKDVLFEAVYRREHRRVVEAVIAAARGARDPIDGLLRGVRAYLHEILDPIARRILLQDAPAVLGWERWRRCEEPGFPQLLEASLQHAAEGGLLRAGVHPPDSAVLILGAMTEGALAVAHSDDPAVTARRLGSALAVHVRALCRDDAPATGDGQSRGNRVTRRARAVQAR